MIGVEEIRLLRDAPAPRPPAECPVEDWLAFLGHRWNALILWHLSAGEKRFGELTQSLPAISPKVLTERLEGLERRGVVARAEIAVFPRGVIYALTPHGKKLVDVLDQLEAWAKASLRRCAAA